MENYRRSVEQDCEQILSRFQSTDSVRYEEFSAIWRHMNFSSIFYGRLEHSESRSFTRLVFSIVGPYFLPPHTFQIRVGGLYLLYGLYNTQLNSPKEKIRLALKNWDDVMELHRDAVNAQHYDVVYILKQLLSEKAFYFTAMPDPLFFNIKWKRGKTSQQVDETFMDRPSRPQQAISTDVLEELANVHEHYKKLKQAVLGEKHKSELSLIRQNLEPKLRGAVLTFHQWQNNQAEFDKFAGEGTSSQEESSHRAQLLESIKFGAYGTAVKACQSLSYRQGEVTKAAMDTEPTGKVSNYKKKVSSLKKRTEQQFMEQINQNKDLMDVSKLWCLTTLKGKTKARRKNRRFSFKQRNRTMSRHHQT
ncbi:snRNA-activating protein complex subunit 1b [Hoplias malabaricus]|uniref:snRNA-activating protein complex subunit 1b n=1 Tax=Hoplias malabaricus TaxID=27720 RepID=UPI003462DCE2